MRTRVERANGAQSRRRILEAATEIAGQLGYSATSISEVSKRSGLPNSSIYWHFKDKDALFAAVIEDSYQKWSAYFSEKSEGLITSPGSSVIQLHESLESFPAFLRFGHLVILEQHEVELGARKAFLEIRHRALALMAEKYMAQTNCDGDTAQQLAAISLALVDGAFLSRVAGEQTFNSPGLLGKVFDTYVREIAPGTVQ